MTETPTTPPTDPSSASLRQGQESASVLDVPLLNLIGTLWRWKAMIVGVTVATALGAGAWSLTRPISYASSATLILAQSRIPAVGDSENSLGDYVELLRSQTLAGRLVADLRLESSGIRAGDLSAFVEIEAVPGTNMITIATTSTDADQSVGITDRLAVLALEFDRDLSQADSIATRGALAEALASARAQFDRLEVQLVAARGQAGSGPLAKEVAGLSQRIVTLESDRHEAAYRRELQRSGAADERIRGAREELSAFYSARDPRTYSPNREAVRRGLREQLEQARLAISASESRVASMEEILSTLPRLLEARSTAEEAPILAEALRRIGNRSDVFGVSVIRELLNPTVTAVERELVLGRAELAGLRSKFARAELRLEQVEIEIAEIEPVLLTANLEATQLEQRHRLALDQYLALHQTSGEGHAAAELAASRFLETTRLTLGEKQLALAEHEISVGRLETEYRIATASYESLADRHSLADAQVAASRTSRLRIVDRASAARGARSNQSILLATLAAILGASFLAVFLDHGVPLLRKIPR